MRRIIAVGLSTTIQQTISFERLGLDRVNRSSSYRLDASGKAVNAARVLHELEPGSALAVSPLGAENEALFRALLAKDGLELEAVRVPGKIRYCYTLLESPTHRATELVVSEPVAPAGTGEAQSEREAFAQALQEIEAILAAHLPSASALLIAGSRPAAFPADAYPRFARLAKAAGVPVMADYHGQDLLDTIAASVPDIIKINDGEFVATFGGGAPGSCGAPGSSCGAPGSCGDPEGGDASGRGDSALIEAIADESRRLDSILVVTRGERSTIAADRGRITIQEVVPVPAVNPIGCGDSFSAGFLHAWAPHRDLAQALEKGTWCATKNALSLRPGSIGE